jgi:hypothetical protein
MARVGACGGVAQDTIGSIRPPSDLERDVAQQVPGLLARTRAAIGAPPRSVRPTCAPQRLSAPQLSRHWRSGALHRFRQPWHLGLAAKRGNRSTAMGFTVARGTIVAIDIYVDAERLGQLDLT